MSRPTLPKLSSSVIVLALLSGFCEQAVAQVYTFSGSGMWASNTQNSKWTAPNGSWQFSAQISLSPVTASGCSGALLGPPGATAFAVNFSSFTYTLNGNPVSTCPLGIVYWAGPGGGLELDDLDGQNNGFTVDIGTQLFSGPTTNPTLLTGTFPVGNARFDFPDGTHAFVSSGTFSITTGSAGGLPNVSWDGISWSHLYGTETLNVNPSTDTFDIGITMPFGGAYHQLSLNSPFWIQAKFIDSGGPSNAPSPSLIGIYFDTATSSYLASVGGLDGNAMYLATVRRDNPLYTIVSQTQTPIGARSGGPHCAALAQRSDGTIEYWLDGILKTTITAAQFPGNIQYAYLYGQASESGQVVSFLDYSEGTGSYPNPPGCTTVTPVSPILLGSSGSAVNPSVSVAEPVNTLTGDYYSSHTDLAVRGRGLSFTLARHYNSLDAYSGPLGVGWNHTYNVFLSQDPESGVVSIKQSDGSAILFAPTGGGNFAPSNPGLFDSLVQNPDMSFTLTRKNQTRLNFSPLGQLDSIVDRNGNTQALSYSGGNLVSVTDTVGRVFSFAYDSNNHLVSVVDPAGRTVRYSYDGSGNLASFQDALGGTTQYAYDANHRMTSATDPRGVVYVQNTFDVQGRVSIQKNGKGAATAFAYNTPSIGTTSVTDPLGNVAQYVYDSNLRIAQIINAQGGSITYTYNSNNDKTSITNANGKTTQFTFDGNGNMTSITNPLSNMAFFTYDANNNLLTSTNPAGAVTKFSYDMDGNILLVQDAIGNKTTFTYDGIGELVSRTDAIGNTSTLAYDGSGNTTTITNALGNTTHFAYDSISRLTSATDGNGHMLTLTYDALSRRTKTSDALGDEAQYAYDAVGNLLKVIDANGNPTAYEYDPVSNLIMVTDALGHSITYGYDAVNNRISFANANGGISTYTYDSLNRRTKVASPLGLATSYGYDAAGNVVSLTDANGKMASFTYDVLNRLILRRYTDGNAISYTYDLNGNRTSMTDSHGTMTYAYDALNRVTQVVSPDGAAVKYAYDGMSHRTTLTYPDGRPVVYSYDSAGRLSRVTDWLNRKTRYSYDAAGNLISVIMGNGATSGYTYDNANRLLNIVNRSGSKVVTSFVYALDAVGNRTQVTDVTGGLTRYSYDALDRLTSWTAPSGQMTLYEYDAAGNRVSMRNSAGVTAYTFDADDRLLTAGAASFTYDGNGNRLTKTAGGTTVSFTFDALNRLTGTSGGGISSQYAYDGDGNRILLQAGTSTYHYSLDVSRRYASVLTENGPDGNVDFQYGLSLL